MEIIEELEPNRRSVYCGAIGYLGFDGAMDTNIAIRTLVCKGNTTHLWAGGGIVADSELDSEYQEIPSQSPGHAGSAARRDGARHSRPLAHATLVMSERAPANDPLADRRVVVKIGGSLCDAPVLPALLSTVARQARSRVVVVPGGGPFADQVRSTQARWRYSERAAHAMALLAMAQYGLMLSAIEPRLVPASNAAAIEALWRQRQVAVWTPAPGELDGEQIEETWDVTSDSLAAWLAGILGHADLLLVKSAPGPSERCNRAAILESDLVDAAFARYATKTEGRICLLGPDEHACLEQMLSGPPAKVQAIE